MKKIMNYILLFVALVGCEEKSLEPISGDMEAPGVVTDITVKNISGGAEIAYTIPNDNDLLYVKATYTIDNGKVMEVKSSMYEKSLVVKGFNGIDNSQEYNVSLTCIDRSDNESEPVTVKIQPEVSPLQKVKNSMQITEAFGGALYNWENPEEEPITFFFMADTITTEGEEPGELVATRILNTSQKEWQYISRGFPDTPREFAVIIRDNYGNETELVKPESIITPLKEEELDKSLMSVFEYGDNPVDDKWNWWEGLPSSLIDGNVAFGSCVISYQTPYPRHITIDLGKTYKLSRYVMQQRRNGNSYLYSYGNPKTWYVYGRSEAPVMSEEITEDLDGDGLQDWTNYWTLIGNHEIVKPSGLAGSDVSQEDIDAALDGHNFDMPMDLGEMRYFRIGVLSNWGNTGWVNWSEMDFYGVEL
ncbi:DUF4959 domain-containing protein [Sunxiuqinia sp. sy24]|uniref:DUF4959 domain-containing protein n=1 Tax=Sunxiuqinia sp. sy24 TaxID=3461495 RepID=UPI0040452BD2